MQGIIQQFLRALFAAQHRAAEEVARCITGGVVPKNSGNISSGYPKIRIIAFGVEIRVQPI